MASVASFEERVERALKNVRRVLDESRGEFGLASKTAHAYSDKYDMMNVTTRLCVASQLRTLEAVGLRADDVAKLVARKVKSHRLRLKVRETCTLVAKESRDETSKTKDVVTKTGLLGTTTTQHKVVTTVTLYKWRFGYEYELVVLSGGSTEASSSTTAVEETTEVLAGRAASWEAYTRTDKAPRPETKVHRDVDVDLTWLLSQVDGPQNSATGLIGFAIDRASAATPRRNDQVQGAVAAAKDLAAWARRARNVLDLTVFESYAKTLGAGWEDGPRAAVPDRNLLVAPVFVPVLPLLKAPSAEARPDAAAAASSMALTADDVARLLDEEDQALEARWREIAEAYLPASSSEEEEEEEEEGPRPAQAVVVSSAEAQLSCALFHLGEVLDMYELATAYVESLLRDQLVAAVGRSITAADFARYASQHSKALLVPEYAPKPLCFAVRQPAHSPEGIVSIEAAFGGTSDRGPIEAFERTMELPVEAMTFALDAATRVAFKGSRHLHAYMPHAFAATQAPRAPASGESLTLTARARQFSSFMLLVGRVGPRRTFEPKHALIVRDKDEVSIPLLLEQLPSAKEFKDAVASLSPEMQRFCRAYRAMQLEGSVFAVLVVQLKPQLEKLLNLPANALTKHIALTQHLLELFIDYQIPSDLLCYDDENAAPTSEKLDRVKQHVAAIYETIDAAKKAQLDEKKARHAFDHPQVMQAYAAEGDDEEGATMELSMDNLEAKAEELQSQTMTFARSGGRGGPSKRSAGLFGAPKNAPRGPRGPPPAAARRAAAPGKGGGLFGGGAVAAPAMMMMRKGQPVALDFAAGASNDALPPPPPAPADDDVFACVEESEAEETFEAAAPSEEGPDLPGGQTPGLPRRGQTPGREVDLTAVPAALEAQFEEHDLDSSLRPTKIEIGPIWERVSRRSLLSKPTTTTLTAEDQCRETQKAFDLLDALSKSGALPLEACSFHAVVAATHCFDASLMDTLVVKNVNPVEKLERSSLIIAATVHDVAPASVLKAAHHRRVAQFSAPKLLNAGEAVDRGSV